MEPLNICINTQTPLIQFRGETGARGPGAPADLSALREGIDYRLSPGGVTRMVYPLAQRMIADGQWHDVRWVALNPQAPPTVRLDGITLHNVALDSDRMGPYGKAKETIWTTVHGLGEPREARDLFWTEDYDDYVFYNRTTAELIRALDREVDFDVFYIHDFQQLPVGQMLGTLKPKVLRWHVPFDERRIPARWRPLVAAHLGAYDAVVVSTDAYARALRRFGYEGRIERAYPFVDPRDYTAPSATAIDEVVAPHGIRPDDTVALVVGRMDPMKGQDRAIRAVAELAGRYRHLKLVLVGNGSFSSARAGLGLSKSAVWRSRLEQLVRELGIEDRVVFTGHATQAELDAWYERCAFTVLPSTQEGFGLVVVESWLHGRPAIVSSHAGIAELIEDGRNGLLFDPDTRPSLASAFRTLLRDRGALTERLAAEGRRTAERCTVDTALDAERRLLGRALEA